VGAKRVLDSTALYDAVAPMDTITLIRSAIRGLLKAAGPEREPPLRSVLRSGDDYAPVAVDAERRAPAKTKWPSATSFSL
jgi:hypothetical protein